MYKVKAITNSQVHMHDCLTTSFFYPCRSLYIVKMLMAQVAFHVISAEVPLGNYSLTQPHTVCLSGSGGDPMGVMVP